MIITDEELLASIERFLERTGIAPTRFGREAMREASFLESLRNGRSLSLRNVNRVLTFMAEYEKANAEAPPADAEDEAEPVAGSTGQTNELSGNELGAVS